MFYHRFSLMLFGLYIGLFCFEPINSSEPKVDDEKHMVILVYGRNNKEFYKYNLDSIFEQKYKNYNVIYIDDASNDGTVDLVVEYIKDKGLEDKFKLIINQEPKYKIASQYYVIHSFCKDSDIVIELDSYDWFLHDKVLLYLNNIYSDPNIWLTYGRFVYYPSGKLVYSKKISKEIIKDNKFRSSDWLYSGFLTYYAGLFKLIRKNDLAIGDNFLPGLSDNIAIFPMFELAAREHFKCITAFLLICNQYKDEMYSEEIREASEQSKSIIKNLPKYSALDLPIWDVSLCKTILYNLEHSYKKNELHKIDKRSRKKRAFSVRKRKKRKLKKPRRKKNHDSKES